MSAEPVYPRSDKAAREVDPMLLANALDHIAKVAAMSHTSTRRLRWIEQRAIFALEGREYRDLDLDLPKSLPETQEKNKRKITDLRRCIMFFASVIKSGEQWTDVCEREYNKALAWHTDITA